MNPRGQKRKNYDIFRQKRGFPQAKMQASRTMSDTYNSAFSATFGWEPGCRGAACSAQLPNKRPTGNVPQSAPRLRGAGILACRVGIRADMPRMRGRLRACTALRSQECGRGSLKGHATNAGAARGHLYRRGALSAVVVNAAASEFGRSSYTGIAPMAARAGEDADATNSN